MRVAIGSGYSITPDGQRFLVNLAIDNPEPPIALVQNWPALLSGDQIAEVSLRFVHVGETVHSELHDDHARRCESARGSGVQSA